MKRVLTVLIHLIHPTLYRAWVCSFILRAFDLLFRFCCLAYQPQLPRLIYRRLILYHDMNEATADVHCTIDRKSVV